MEVAVYDYIIVGGGSAGSVLAGRLSEDPEIQVLLLEAGPSDDAAEIRLPAAATTLWRGPFAWDDETSPQRAAGDRRVFWPHGRVLGGSSSINGLIYIRGNPRDYDRWRDEYGCVGWGYADLLPYFRRCEDQERGGSRFHGVGGPLRVEDPRYVHPFSRAWLDAARAAGLPGNVDFNGGTQDGVGFYQHTERGGRRWSTADAYLRPAARRGNLHVQPDAVATRVVVEHGRACGVRYLRHGAEMEARVRREVVLSAGAVNSPKLLLLSGIGPAEQVRAHGIVPVVDAPGVGEGLQDHPACFVVWRTPSTRNLWEPPSPEDVAMWHDNGQGPLASAGIEVGGFGRTREGLAAPDVQYAVAAAPPPLPELGPPTQRMASMIVWAVDVRSRGRLTLASADPSARPVINPAYLADPADVDILVAGVRQARQIAAQSPLAELLAGEESPGVEIRDDDQIRSWVRTTVSSIFHPAGTCAMGAHDLAVCDPELRVRGVAGLRVVDASVMPVLPRGNTNAPTIAIAERAADLIRGLSPLPAADAQLGILTADRA